MRRLVSICAILLLCVSLSAAESMDKLTQRVFRLAAEQYKAMSLAIPEGMAPKSVDAGGDLECKDLEWWTSGFYPGTLWYIYEYTGDEQFRELAEAATLRLGVLLDKPTHHDIGFQINNSFGNGLRLTGDRAKYQDTVLKAADKLLARFDPKVGCIKSWDNPRWKYPVIIDNMMNLQLLTDAYRICGKKEYLDVATAHANMTMNQHFRPDYSTYHLVDFDPETGSVIRRQTHQGKSDDSMWARGEAWALYGFTMMYRTTGEDVYLKQAEYIASLLFRTLPEDGIPYWDFSCPGDLRDASAAAIMASAFVQLYECLGDLRMLQLAEKMLRKLSSPEYLAKKGTNGGFLLKHCVGNMPAGSEVDVPLSYADYYYLEALMAYRRATSHCKILLTDRDMERIRKQLADGSNPVLTRVHELMLKFTDELPDVPVTYSFDASGMRLAPAPRVVYDRLVGYSYAYRFTGDRKYVTKAEKVISEACALYDWNGYHFLDVAGIVSGMAIAYDWLYDELNPKLRAQMCKAVYEKAFLDANQMNKAWWYNRANNWNQVCNGGMIMAAIAMREDFGRVAGNFIPNCVKTNRNVVKQTYAPNGCFPEGPGYWLYANTFQALICSTFDSALGADFGISGITGMSEAADYLLNCYGATHQMFNYYDNNAKEFFAPAVWYFAWRYDKPYLLRKELEFMKDDSYKDQNYTLLPLIAKFASQMDLSRIESPTVHMYEGKGETPIVVWCKDWTSSETDAYLGIKGGKAVTNHGHMDVGSFVFDRMGVRWAVDPGNVRYTDIEPIVKAMGGNYWEKAQDSYRWKVYPMNNYWHNTLTINGDLHEVNGVGSIREVVDSDEEHGALIDITDVFVGMEKVNRRITVDSSDILTIVDDIVAGENDAKVRFSWVTEAQPELTATGAVLRSGDKSVTLRSEGEGVSYSIRQFDEPFAVGKKIVDIEWTVPAGTAVTVKTILE